MARGTVPAMNRELWRAVVVGALAGFLSGLFGVGGGILIVPGLVLLTRMEQRLAHGTSLTAIIPIACSGVVGYLLADEIDWPVGGLVAMGAVAGAIAGTYALRVLPQHTLRLAFAVMMVATAVRMLAGTPDAVGRGDIDLLAVLGLITLGLASGGLAGLLGVGGGIIMVPAFVLLFSLPAALAKGTSLLVILPTSLMGTVRNRKHGNTDVRIAAAVGLSGVITAFVASQISVDLDPDLSNALFAALLLFVAVRMLIVELRDRRSRRSAASLTALH